MVLRCSLEEVVDSTPRPDGSSLLEGVHGPEEIHSSASSSSTNAQVEATAEMASRLKHWLSEVMSQWDVFFFLVCSFSILT